MFPGHALLDLGDVPRSDLELLGDAPPGHAFFAQPPDLSAVSGRQLGGAMVLAAVLAQNPIRPFVVLSDIESSPTWFGPTQARGFPDAR